MILVADGEEAQPPRIEIKGKRARWNLSEAAGDEAGYRIFDAATMRLFTVSPSIRAVSSAPIPSPPSPPRWTLSLVDRAGRVAQAPCERWRTTDGKASYDLCLARGFLPVPVELTIPNVARVAPFLPELEGQGYFPMAVVARWGGDAGATVTGTLRAVEIDRRVVDATRVEVPPFPVTETNAAVPLMPAPH